MRSLLPTRRAVAATVAAPLLLLGAAACGGDGSTPAAEDAASESAAAGPSEAAESAEAGRSAESAEVEAESSESPEVEETEATGSGDGSWDEKTLAPAMMAAMADQETSRFRMTTTGGGTDVEAEGVMSYRGDSQDMAMTMSGAMLGAASMELRAVDGVMYLSMPPMTPKGKFLEIRPGDKSSPFAGMMDQIPVDPRDSVEAFESGLRDVEFLGEEETAGETLERYRLTVDFSAAAKSQGMPRMQGAPETVDYEMWLDEDALLRRMELDMMQVGVVMEMSDWGEPVRIEAPARRQIVEGPGSAGSWAG